MIRTNETNYCFSFPFSQHLCFCSYCVLDNDGSAIRLTQHAQRANIHKLARGRGQRNGSEPALSLRETSEPIESLQRACEMTTVHIYTSKNKRKTYAQTNSISLTT